MNYSTRPFLSILILALVLTAAFTFRGLIREGIYKKDLIELSEIKYGLFNVDEWKEAISEIITAEIEEFRLDESNRPEMERKVSSLLHTAIDALERSYYQENSQGILGFFKGSIALVTDIFGKIRRDIPMFTNQILDFLNEADNRAKIKSFLIQKLNEYSDGTFSQTDYSEVNKILTKYNQTSIQEAKSVIQNKIMLSSKGTDVGKGVLVFLAFITGGLLLLDKSLSLAEIPMLLAICLIYLALGLSLPMIEIDARISELRFTLLGHDVSFLDQVLYFKSKSILEVVSLMLFQNKLELMLIGVLVLLFSVVFPTLKLICTWFFSRSPQREPSRLIKFMLFKSGKWSMADVFVVAIFMAFIGFDGIVTEQIKQLENVSDRLDVLTTNHSSLMYGFYLFLIFVILSIGVSHRIQNLIK
jgi:hypothetical protein